MSIKVTAETTGLIQEILVQAGARVAVGDTVLLLESMKMEFPVDAPATGHLKVIHVKVGDTVQQGSVLFEMREGVE